MLSDSPCHEGCPSCEGQIAQCGTLGSHHNIGKDSLDALQGSGHRSRRLLSKYIWKVRQWLSTS